MISVDEALRIIKENTVSLLPVKSSLQNAAGKMLAEDIFASTDIPAFPQSSMDGYAFLFDEQNLQKKILIKGEVAAGSAEKFFLAAGEAVRIFTGAPVPAGADTVVMQEKVRINYTPGAEAELIIKDGDVKRGANVRSKGSEIRAGVLALQKESLLSPAAVGFLAGIGIGEVLVYPDPSVIIIITGNEWQQAGKPLQYGQVYESNSITLTTALYYWNINDIKVFYADDNLEMLSAILTKALNQSDMVLLTGGISAGDYDFVLQAANNCGVSTLFHKIKQRPGKPLFFGKKENKIVFGLPGNPSSVLTCFYEYVLQALQILSKQKIALQIIRAPLQNSFTKTSGLTHFLKGFYNGSGASVLDAQESYRLSSFAKANCLVKINEEVKECKEGEIVEVHLLPV